MCTSIDSIQPFPLYQCVKVQMERVFKIVLRSVDSGGTCLKDRIAFRGFWWYLLGTSKRRQSRDVRGRDRINPEM